MKIKQGIILGGLLFAASLMGLNTGCSKKQDFVRINNVRYDFGVVHFSRNSVGGISDCLTLKADLEGYDREGIKEVHCYVDGEYYNKTDILDWITEGKLNEFRPFKGDIKRL